MVYVKERLVKVKMLTGEGAFEGSIKVYKQHYYQIVCMHACRYCNVCMCICMFVRMLLCLLPT
jgi:hypothetical protein